MESLLQHWSAWIGCTGAQLIALGIVHLTIRQRIGSLDYFISGALGISAWLVPLLITVLALGLDPRPSLFIIATCVAMLGGIAIETRARREDIRAVLFYVGLVLAASLPAWALIAWVACAPPPRGSVWIEQLIMSCVGIFVVGGLTILLHYSEMLEGVDLYRRNGMTPCEQKTVADAVYIVNRKLRPHLGDVLARMKRADESLQAGMSNVESIDSFLTLVVTMLNATISGADEAFVETLRRNVRSDNGFHVAGRQ